MREPRAPPPSAPGTGPRLGAEALASEILLRSCQLRERAPSVLERTLRGVERRCAERPGLPPHVARKLLLRAGPVRRLVRQLAEALTEERVLSDLELLRGERALARRIEELEQELGRLRREVAALRASSARSDAS